MVFARRVLQAVRPVKAPHFVSGAFLNSPGATVLALARAFLIPRVLARSVRQGPTGTQCLLLVRAAILKLPIAQHATIRQVSAQLAP